MGSGDAVRHIGQRLLCRTELIVCSLRGSLNLGHGVEVGTGEEVGRG